MSEFSSFDIFQVDDIFEMIMSFRKKWQKRLTETWQKKEKRGLEKRRTISKSVNGDICLPFLLVTYLCSTTIIFKSI